MHSLKTVLVVEDDPINRKILSKILSTDYLLLEAANGEEGIALLRQRKSAIAAVILDLVMPVMDGYAFLSDTHCDPAYQNLPIIVSTGNGDSENEREALKLGAWDFVSKPYDPEILKFRLKNAIERSQLTALHQLKYLAEYDPLTEIYNKTKFFEMTRTMLDASHQESFVFLRLDIDRFQLINSYYGSAEGDKLLKHFARVLTDLMDRQIIGTYGRMEADIFACCIPYGGRDAVEALVRRCKENLRSFSWDFNLVPTCGAYVIPDNSEEISLMLGKAGLASKQVKGKYLKNCAFYTAKMSQAIEMEQEITNEMAGALANGEFQIYLQPKYNLSTNSPEGAEALVRWMHPRKGMVFPGTFIPVFERNGFISRLDYDVWEQVCRVLKRWIDHGEQPFPISVNVSRVNIYTPDLVERICGLTEKYQIPNHLLQLELTESAYTDNPQVMMDTMRRLQSKGFMVLMDDFGSGYSSLNILKDLEVNILKLDMKFLSNTKIPGRGENIISSVVRMAKWLHIPVIAEGVEKQEQADFLREIGCEYVQGYYFAQPMTVEAYEDLVKSKTPFRPVEGTHVGIDQMWEPHARLETLLSSALYAVAIYEFADNRVEILRVNQAFYDLVGRDDTVVNTGDALQVVSREYRGAVMTAFCQAAVSAGTVEVEYRRETASGKPLWLQLKLKRISHVGNRQILLGNFLDITAQRELDIELQKYRMIAEAGHVDTGRMLIVDDLKTNRKILKGIFQNRFTILEAENGQQALDVLKEYQNQVDIILLDLMMPVMDGTEFLEIKRATTALSDIPIIIITADESAECQINTLALGANDYIIKPFVEEIVVRRVDNVLESNRRFREILQEYDMVVRKARTDPLTGIFNRAITEQLINHILLNQAENTHALIMIDVDHFKSINDTCGHACGDEVLSYLARRLSAFFRRGDVIGRFGGDEFCVFMMGVPSATLVAEKCAALCRMLSENPESAPVPFTISVGAAITGPNAADFTTLYQNADQALYDAKRQGKNQAAMYGQGSLLFAMSAWINKESLIEALDAAVVAIDDETYDLLYCNEAAKQFFGVSDIHGKKCYEILRHQHTPCVSCKRGRLSFDTYEQGTYLQEKTGKKMLSREKLLALNGRRIHLQLLLDLSGAEHSARSDREDEDDGHQI